MASQGRAGRLATPRENRGPAMVLSGDITPGRFVPCRGLEIGAGSWRTGAKLSAPHLYAQSDPCPPRPNSNDCRLPQYERRPDVEAGGWLACQRVETPPSTPMRLCVSSRPSTATRRPGTTRTLDAAVGWLGCCEAGMVQFDRQWLAAPTTSSVSSWICQTLLVSRRLLSRLHAKGT